MNRAGTESYIVRIYRRNADDIVGVVEMPVQEREQAFRSFAELQAILLRESRRHAPTTAGPE